MCQQTVTEGKGKDRGSEYTRHGCCNKHPSIPLLEPATQETEPVEIWLHSCKSHSLKINGSLSFQLNFNLKSMTGANQHSSTCVSDLCYLRIWPNNLNKSPGKICCNRDPEARFLNV